MEFNNDRLVVEVANRALDEFEFNGKTIREWAELLTNPKTNADRIRSMTDEELAEFISSGYFAPHCPTMSCGETQSSCEECWLKWLKQEVDT